MVWKSNGTRGGHSQVGVAPVCVAAVSFAKMEHTTTQKTFVLHFRFVVIPSFFERHVYEFSRVVSGPVLVEIIRLGTNAITIAVCAFILQPGQIERRGG